MIFSPEGFPRCNAHDFADSPVIAAWMAIVGHPNQIDMRRYCFVSGHPVRYPYGKSTLEKSPRCMSRDQLIMLCAGEFHQHGSCIYKPGLFAPNDMDEVTGKWKMPDIYSPSARNHFRLCNGEKGTWLGYQNLKLDIWYASKTEHEHNQLQAMCIVAGPEYVKRYVKANPNWKIATYLYWYDNRGEIPGHAPTYNRGELELANMICAKIESYL